MSEIKENAPKRFEKNNSLVGEVLAIELATPKAGSPFYIITVENAQGEETTVTMGQFRFEQQINKRGWMSEGIVVNLSGEIRIKDKTTYTTSEGEVKYHSFDGHHADRANKVSKRKWARLCADADRKTSSEDVMDKISELKNLEVNDTIALETVKFLVAQGMM